jgi:hypothetical protein
MYTIPNFIHNIHFRIPKKERGRGGNKEIKEDRRKEINIDNLVY